MENGKPTHRIDGPLKVTGQLRYAADESFPHQTYAAVATSTVSRGRIARIELEPASRVPGILKILTHENVGGRISELAHFRKGGQANGSIRPLDSSEVYYYGQIVALVVAETLEIAEHAAAQIRFHYEQVSHAATFDSPGLEVIEATDAKIEPPHENPTVGQAEDAFARAPHKIDARYSTPPQHHNPMELLSTTCSWEGTKLTIYEPNRFVVGLQHGVAKQLRIPASDVRVVAGSLGGHFGSKLAVSQFTAIAAIAAHELARPVKLHLSRAQCFTVATYRGETRHRVRLGADGGGRLNALIHEVEELTSRADEFIMSGVELTARLYACPNVKTNVRLAKADRNTPGPMRAPPEVPYFFALESALDELAVELSMDPVELRRRNDTNIEPIKGLPYSSRPLMRCWDEAATAFGWRNRSPEPRSMREGEWLIGWGCASLARATQIAPASISLKLSKNKTARVRTAHHEIGNGISTLLAQMVADEFSLPLSAITVELGDTAFPPASVSGGSSTTTSLCHALQQACRDLHSKLVEAARTGTDPFGITGNLEVATTFLPKGSKPDALQKLQAGLVGLGAGGKDHLSVSMGAHFVEVRVHELTGEIRVPRMVGAFAAGKIMNPLLAESQYLGGMVWGLSSALLEATSLDPQSGGYANADLENYLVPVCADIGEHRAILVEDEDKAVNEMGIKGLGESGIIGVNAAIANAVFHATGKRVRRLPIRVEDLL